MLQKADEYDPSTDILYGARDIAKWLFRNNPSRRRVYYYARIKSGIPFFKTGNTICLSKSEYQSWVKRGGKPPK